MGEALNFILYYLKDAVNFRLTENFIGIKLKIFIFAIQKIGYEKRYDFTKAD